MFFKGTVSEMILRQLYEWGITEIYGVSGHAVFPLLDALAKQDKIKYIGTATEEGASYMASCSGKITGIPGVCIATSGPGTVGLLNGIADAYMDGNPMLVITGQVDSAKIGLNTKQYFNQQSIMSSFTSYSVNAVNPQNIKDLVVKFLRVAVSEQTVCHLSIPQDFFHAVVSGEIISKDVGSNFYISRGITEGVERVARDLDKYDKPIIILGKEGRGSINEIKKLANLLKAPIVLSQEAKGFFSDEEDGAISGIGEAFKPSFLYDADCYLLFGSAPYEEKYLDKNKPLYQIQYSAAKISASTSYPLVGELKNIINYLLQKIDKKKRSSKWQYVAKKAKENIRESLEFLNSKGDSSVHPAQLSFALSEVIPEDSIIVLDIGNYVHWFDTYFKVKNHDILISSMWRGMGSGIPYAISAKLKNPSKKVICLTGDGGLISSLPEVLTTVKYHIDINIIVINNGMYLLERDKMHMKKMQPFGHEIYVPDLISFAESCGIKGYKISNIHNFESILQAGLEEKISLIDVHSLDASLQE